MLLSTSCNLAGFIADVATELHNLADAEATTDLMHAEGDATVVIHVVTCVMHLWPRSTASTKSGSGTITERLRVS